MKPFLSSIFPVRGDSEEWPLVLLDIDKKLSESGFSYEILIVNGGADDEIVRAVGRLGRIVKNVKIVDGGRGRSLGGMVRRGMLAAKGSYRFFVCGIGSMPPGRIEDVFSRFKEGRQLIAGSGNYPAFGFFTEEAAAAIFNAAKINGWGFAKEATALARFFGFKVDEIKITGDHRLTMRNRLSILWDSIRVHYWLSRKSYSMEKGSF